LTYYAYCCKCVESYKKFALCLKLMYAVSQKSISDIFDCNLKNNNQILIIFGKNILDTACHQTTI